MGRPAAPGRRPSPGRSGCAAGAGGRRRRRQLLKCRDFAPPRHPAGRRGVLPAIATGRPRARPTVFHEETFPMRFRNWIATLALAAVAMPTWAADAPPAAPTLLIRLKSVDGIMADAHYFATLVGQEEQAKQFEKLLPAFLGPQGLAGTGIDTKKPIGAYGILDPQLPNSQVVVM